MSLLTDAGDAASGEAEVVVDLLAEGAAMYTRVSDESDAFELDTSEPSSGMPLHHQRLGEKTIGHVQLQAHFKVLIKFALQCHLNGGFKVKYDQLHEGTTKTPQMQSVLHALINTDPHCGPSVRLFYRCLLEVHHNHFWKTRDDPDYAARASVIAVDRNALLEMYKVVGAEDKDNLPAVYDGARKTHHSIDLNTHRSFKHLSDLEA